MLSVEIFNFCPDIAILGDHCVLEYGSQHKWISSSVDIVDPTSCISEEELSNYLRFTPEEMKVPITYHVIDSKTMSASIKYLMFKTVIPDIVIDRVDSEAKVMVADTMLIINLVNDDVYVSGMKLAICTDVRSAIVNAIHDYIVDMTRDLPKPKDRACKMMDLVVKHKELQCEVERLKKELNQMTSKYSKYKAKYLQECVLDQI